MTLQSGRQRTRGFSTGDEKLAARPALTLAAMAGASLVRRPASCARRGAATVSARRDSADQLAATADRSDPLDAVGPDAVGIDGPDAVGPDARPGVMPEFAVPDLLEGHIGPFSAHLATVNLP